MMDAVPIIFIHYGPASYLHWTLNSARRTNPEKRIILLGDEGNRRFTKGLADFFLFQDYAIGSELDEFERVFQVLQGERHHFHKPGGIEAWLKFVFRRWFLINEFLKAEKINGFWIFDSDTLLLASLGSREARYADYEATTQCRGRCLNGWIGSQKLVANYIQCINELFKDEVYLEKQRERLKQDMGLAFNEMDAFQEYCRRETIKTCQASNVINGEAFDDALAITEGYEIADKQILGRTNIKSLWISKNRNLYAQQKEDHVMVRLLSSNMSWMPDYFWKRLYHLTRPSSSLISLDNKLIKVPLNAPLSSSIFRFLLIQSLRLKKQAFSVFSKLLQSIKKKLHQEQKPVLRLKPKQSSKGTVVISYLTWPFLEGYDALRARGHTNAFEVVTMAEIYQELGYDVEIVDFNNNDYQPPLDTVVAIDLHGQLERWNKVLSKKTLRILHATGAYWKTANQAEQIRLAGIKDRRGKFLAPQRQVSPSRSAELADKIVVLGNEYTMESFRFADKSITRIPISSAYEFPWPEQRDISQAKKNFLWIGSYGMVHKGLDLVLEAFSQMPELSLTICGRPEKEEDFFKLYEKELLQTPNIKLHAWIDMASPEFLEIAATHASIIYPSCSEGGGGSVIHCMHAGMVPLCTREASVDFHDFGILIQQGNVEGVIQAARRFASLTDQEVDGRARASYDHVRTHHTRDQFRKNYHDFAAMILKTMKEKV